MIESRKSFVDKKFLFLLISVFLIVTDIAILLGTPFLRQILGFLFLTILPGLLILQILKLNKIGSTEKFVLAVGLSISFLMFFGLLINNLSLTLGYETPLSTIFLLIASNISFITLAIIGYKVNKEPFFSLPNINLSTSEKAFLIVPILFPALSIFGMNLMNTTDNNIIVMFLLFLIPVYVASICIFNNKFPTRIYPVAIFLIGMSLLFLMALRSSHIIGIDTHQEYYLFKATLDNLHWRVVIWGNALDACLSISLLPTIYHSILNIPSEFLFKVLYSLFFSVSPLVIYILSKRYVGELYGFLASCFFMSQLNFLWTEHHARTNTAILFFALAMMVLFSDKIDPLKKRILFIVFMASCMVSHYATTYIFFFLMLGTFIGVEILSKKYTFKKVMSLTIVVLFFAFIFFWYSQVTETAFNAAVRFVDNTLTSLNNMFGEELRSESAHAMLGENIWQKDIPHKIEFVFTWLIFAFIGIGVITLIRRYKEISFSERNFKKPDFLKDKFEVEYFIIALVCSGLLVATVVLPYISAHYGMDRLYFLAIVILSVFFVIGGIIVAKYLDKLLSKKKIVKNKREVQAYVIILLVLIPYFFCTTGVLYQMFSIPQIITLNSEGKGYDMLYVHDQESYGAKWLKSHNTEKAKTYTSDGYMGERLLSQGGIRSRTIRRYITRNYIYLGYNNVVYGKTLGRVQHNLTENFDFGGMNKIYANGGSEVWK